MIKLLLLFITITYISSEQILTISVQEKRLMNTNENGKLPLIVKPSEDVSEDIELACNGNIRYYPEEGSESTYDLGDETTLPIIPAGTKAGTEIKFNCILYFDTYNTIITLAIDESLIEGEDGIKWKDDKNNNKIEFVPKFIVNPSYATSKNLEKNGVISLDITLMDDITTEISIADETFILNKEDNSDVSINLVSCSKIPENSRKGDLKITCSVEEEVKDGKFLLKLGQGKKIDEIEPKVSGYIVFSSTSAQANNSRNYFKLLNFSLIIIILLF